MRGDVAHLSVSQEFSQRPTVLSWRLLNTAIQAAMENSQCFSKVSVYELFHLLLTVSPA